MNPVELAVVCTLAPAAAALLGWAFYPLRHRGMPAAVLCLIGTGVSLAAAVRLLTLNEGPKNVVAVIPWLVESGRPVAEIGVRLDGISVSMLVMVGLVALCVQLFSLGYMHGEPPMAFGRYFTLHALFLFSMNVAVIAPNLLQLFAGWELVGLTSYLLIGYYFQKPEAAKAAVKAFWMTKLADMGFLFALLVLWVKTGRFDWEPSAGPEVSTVVAGLLFLAVLGKSAQFPLHIWLPDAMQGPTPVSALLHAATMVAAGVYMVVRASPLFEAAPMVREGMLWVGCVTALFAALLALVQSDLKKVLAFSTCSQLGYMVAALGAGQSFAAYFHLGTHAFFKALLFLAAGSVIHAVHSNELSDMGGLRKNLPFTATTFGIGALSLSGVPGFAGFFSKDLVLSSLEGHQGWVPWLMLMATAALTALYMGRVVLRVFFGTPRISAEHAHEGDWSMTVPLFVLAIPALLSGFWGAWLAGEVGATYALHLGLTPVVASLSSVLGLGLAFGLFRTGRPLPGLGLLTRLDALSVVDRTWATLYRVGLLGISGVAGWVDRYLVDGLINLLGYATLEGAESARTLQTGRVRDYSWAVAMGVVALVLMGVLW